ncbi:MAG: ATP-binding protein, partial [Bacillota bacterium]|nr:ATP-binding protein [Bacillota bacterium]
SIQSQVQSVPPNVWQQMANTDDASGPMFEEGPHHAPFFFLPDASIALIDEAGTFTVLSNSSVKVGTPQKLPQQDYQDVRSSEHKLTYKVVKPTEGDEQLIVLQTIRTRDHIPEIVQVSLSTKPLKEMMLQQLFMFLGISSLALIGAILAFIPVLRKTLVPLSNMVDTVEQIDVENLAERLPVDQGQVEIDRLANSFNRMLHRLELSFEAEKESKEQMRRFVADASHELRTPLTVIHGFIEVLLRGAMNQPEMLNRSLTSMYTESERMKKLVEDLLLLAKLDRTPKIELTEGALDEIIKNMAPQLRLLAGNRKVSLRLVSNLRCWFDTDKIKQVILNLFHNAVQHTDPEKGEIQISLATVGRGIELAVGDNGLGIPKEHLSMLFDRFYRSDSSRTRKYGGAGLGLAITKSIVELHGGTIRVESVADEGTTFYIWLPIDETS